MRHKNKGLVTTKALLIIDHTNGFVADNGVLTCNKPVQGLEDCLVQLANRFYQDDDYIIFPTDVHCRGRFSPETKLFPPHNVVGTPGQQLYGKVNDWFEQHQANGRVCQFNKNHYLSFQSTNLDNYLRERKVNNLRIAGVCTDICVLHTAITTYSLNYQITIPVKGVITFAKHSQGWALGHSESSLDATLVR